MIDKNVCEQPNWVTAWHIQDSAEVVMLLKPVDFYFELHAIQLIINLVLWFNSQW